MKVLMYHAVLPPSERAPAVVRGHVHADALERHLRWLRRNAQVLSLAQAVEMIRAGTPYPRRATVLTFDDGLWNQAEFAFPLLQQYGLPATFFVPTGHLDSDRLLWFNRLVVEAVARAGFDASSLSELQLLRAWVEEDPGAEPSGRVAERFGLKMPDVPCTERLRRALGGMTSDQLLSMSQSPLVEIGAHTVTHPRLTLCPPEQLEREVTESRRALESVLQRTIRFFAYPEGGLNDAVESAIKRAGYEAAVAVEPVEAQPNNVYRLTRPVINADSTLRMVAKWAGLVGPVRRVRRMLGLRVPGPQP